MRAKSMLFRYLQLLLLAASFTLLTQTINAEENGTDVNDTITATANLLKSSYTIGQPVPIEIVFTNHGQEPAYIKVDEFGFLRTNVIVEDANSSKIYPLYVYSPPPPPRYFWITIDGKKIYTEPVVKIEPGQTTKLAIQDALDLYHDQLQPGTYYLTPREQEVIHEVDSIITREDQEHKLWIQPSAVISKARYKTNKVEITLYQGNIIYVDDDGPADFSTIQAAIDDANDGDTVLVAPGSYIGEGNRDIDFKGMAITVRSEEGPENCIIDCQGTEDDPHRGFYFHSGEEASSILQGFTVNNGYILQDGGAICCNMSSPSIVNCVISNNKAVNSRAKGGGIALIESEAHIISCVIRNNIAQLGDGGGIYISNNSVQMPRITGCIISSNTATAAPMFGGEGGGVALFGNGYLLNCVITGNRAGYWGGGISCRMPHHQGFLSNSIVWANISSLKSTASQLAMPTCNYDEIFSLTIWNSIIADGNGNDGIYIMSAKYNCITGSWLTINPLFIQPGYWDIRGTPGYLVDPEDDIWIDGDYHLKSQAGRWDPSSQSWVVDDVTSPCIDAGDPNVPVGDESEPNGGRINMGAYGGTPQASKSYILAKIIYVDDDATGANDGSSWQNAYTFLQDALADAKTSEKSIEIRVAQGVYKPNQGARNRIIIFQLINGVTLLGGYAGLTEPDPDIRDVEKYEAILSGDLNGDDIDVSNPSDLPDEPTRSDNCSSIVIGSHTDRTAVLDGFIITGGLVRRNRAIIDSPTGVGGGMQNYYGSPTINNCTFTGNSAEGSGGGMINIYDSSPILTNCKFINNYGGRGGGVYNLRSNPTFINCTFKNNYADDGAGMGIGYWEPAQAMGTELIDCIFEDNNAKDSGGGLYLYNDEAALTNCVFIGNSASKGGGLYNNSGDLNLTNCQFIGNYAQEEGGGLAGSNSKLIDCIFIDNSSNGYGGGLAGNNSIYNCIISGNTAVNNGGAIYGWGEVINCTVISNRAGGNGGGIYTQGIVTLTNNIIRDNKALLGNEIYAGLCYKHVRTGPPIIISTSVVTVRYNNIKGREENIPIETDCSLAWGPGNIDVDPLFTNPGYWDSNNTPDEPNDDIWVDGDYRLKSQAGRWDPDSQSWVQDDVTSPCIDAGDPNSPIGHEPFPNGGIINMGAYGGTEQASKSLTTIGSRY